MLVGVERYVSFVPHLTALWLYAFLCRIAREKKKFLVLTYLEVSQEILFFRFFYSEESETEDIHMHTKKRKPNIS